MAFLSASSISSLAVALLRRSITLPATVLRVPGGEYDGPNGATINVRVRVPRQYKQQETPGEQIEFSDLEELSVPVTMRHLYDAAHVTDEDLTLTLENFGQQVLAPMVATVAEGAEDQVASVFNSLLPDDELASSPSAEDTDAAVKHAREVLTTRRVPVGNRTLAAAPDIITRILDVDKFVKVNEAGGTTALEQATFGSIYGFRVIESAALTPGTFCAYHRSAVAWANRPPVEASSVDSATTTEDGVSLRVVRAFDVSHLREAVAVSTFAGAAAITDDVESGESETPRVYKYEIGS